jgi:hypothetical protein
MNIFYLHNDPKTCAQMHNDKHVVKMILEYAQLLSTAHRVIDGVEEQALSKSGRKQKVWRLNDDREDVIYKASHINHPSAKWVRHGEQNYRWLFNMWACLLEEYTHRYAKHHSAERLLTYLARLPKNINTKEQFSAPWRAMPDEFKVDRSVPDYTIESYRAYYLGAKTKMSRWTNRQMPDWFVSGIYRLYTDTCYVEYKPKLNRIISMPLLNANVSI